MEKSCAAVVAARPAIDVWFRTTTGVSRLTGVEVLLGAGVGVGVGLGVFDAEGVGEGVEEGVGLGEADWVGVGVRLAAGVGVGVDAAGIVPGSASGESATVSQP